MAKMFSKQKKAAQQNINPQTLVEMAEEVEQNDVVVSEKECFLSLLSNLRSQEMNETDFKRAVVRIKRASVWACELYKAVDEVK